MIRALSHCSSSPRVLMFWPKRVTIGVVLAGGFKEVVEAAGLFEIGADDRSHSGLPCPPFPLVSPCNSARDLPKGNEMDAARR